MEKQLKRMEKLKKVWETYENERIFSGKATETENVETEKFIFGKICFAYCFVCKKSKFQNTQILLKFGTDKSFGSSMSTKDF